MHEVAIIEGLIDIIDKQKEQHKFSCVTEIHINCGIYNCASEDNLNFCLKTVAQGTYIENARIFIKRLPEKWTCSLCQADFVREGKEEPDCPQCGSQAVLPRSNSEIYLNNLEVD